MTLQLTSQTMLRAADGRTPNSRLTVGIGENVILETNRSNVQWSIPDHSVPNGQPSTVVRFFRPGRHTISVQAGSHRDQLTLNVVAPSIDVHKIGEIQLPRDVAGVLMHLEFQLTPLNVSFCGTRFRERECGPDRVWGYFERHREAYRTTMQHRPNIHWTRVDQRNRVTQHDQAGFEMQVSRMNWPITAGGFQWNIPDELDIDGRVVAFGQPMSQAIRFDPSSGAERPPFRGRVTIWKGGQEVHRDYR